jgi:hypothetical protein
MVLLAYDDLLRVMGRYIQKLIYTCQWLFNDQSRIFPNSQYLSSFNTNTSKEGEKRSWQNRYHTEEEDSFEYLTEHRWWRF